MLCGYGIFEVKNAKIYTMEMENVEMKKKNKFKKPVNCKMVRKKFKLFK